MATIGFISDLHIDSDGDPFPKLKESLSELEDSKVDLIFVLGDIAGNAVAGEEENLDLSLIKETKNFIAENTDKEVIFVAGNHEKEYIEEFEQIYGNKPYGITQVKGENLIWLNTASKKVSGSRGQLSHEQMRFLDSKLDDLEEASLILHHSIHYRDLSHTYWWDKYPERAFCGNKKEINKLLDKHGNVRAVFNGHIHDYNHTAYKDVDHFTVAPFVSESRKNGFEGSFGIAEINENIKVRMENEEGTLDSWKV